MLKEFERILHLFDETDWRTALDSLLGEIHEVDRTAVRIWFRLYPLDLARYIESAEDKKQAIRGLTIQGLYSLKGQIDASHRFLYGQRYWKTVKEEIAAATESFSGGQPDLGELTRKIAGKAAERLGVEVSLVLGISAVGLMTLTQVGLDEFKKSSGEVEQPKGLMSRSPDQIVAEREKDDWQGLLGFLKTVDKKFSIIYDENAPNRRFTITNDQQIASASAQDRSQNWQAKDERCWEGPVPVECTSASCGTCWIGVIAGAEKLSEISAREERAIKVFGYDNSDEARPFIRLACQAKAYGNATIVIPPWNGVFGKKVYRNVEDVELEPATSSAKALREAVREVTAGGRD